jgi:uncharacterized membrane protein
MENNKQTQSATNSVITSYTNSQTGAQKTVGKQQTSQKQMGAKSVIGVFSSRHEAERAIENLRQQGFTDEEINIISKEHRNDREYYDDDITDGALTGGTLGGIGGLILGAGALAIPGIGPVLAAGPIAAALSGAVAGGITGGLIDWGIPAESSRHYEQHVAQGNILTVIRTQETKVQQAAQILRQSGAKDVESH